MSNNKQSSSSIDWLISQLQKSKDWHRVLNEISQMSSAKIDIIAKAKAMHKEESMDANFYGQRLHAKSVTNTMMEDNAEQYYNETFGGEK